MTIDELSKTKDCVFVFDIDSTLYNVSPRSQIIYEHFLKEHSKFLLKMSPELVLELKQLNLGPLDWGVTKKAHSILKKHSQVDESFLKALHGYWVLYFFHHKFLWKDQLYVGIKDCVLELSRNNLIYYCTGRDQSRMRAGTEKQLKSSGLTLNSLEHLYCKKHKKHDDKSYKLEVLRKIQSKNKNKKLIFIDNEVALVNYINKESESFKILCAETVHSGAEELDLGIAKLAYSLN